MRCLQSALHTREINVFCFKPLLRPSIQAIWHIDGILLQMQILLQEKLNAEQERKKSEINTTNQRCKRDGQHDSHAML